MIYFLSLKKIFCVVISALLLAWIFYAQPSFTNDQVVCEEIAREVEIKNKLPRNILTSISLVEAGRKHIDGSVKSWPWSLNHSGKSAFFENKAEALDYLKKNITSEFKNIDVGCMQINVRWHRENFDSLETMINPRENIEYAASFLANLKTAHGSWEKAIKHYHSSTPRLNIKYYAKVQQAWNRKINNNSLVQTVALSSDDKVVYPRLKSIQLDYTNFEPYSNIDIAENNKPRVNLTKPAIKSAQNENYLNVVLINSNKEDNKDDFKRYIKYKSAYLGKKIDMILLFREEFSKN